MKVWETNLQIPSANLSAFGLMSLRVLCHVSRLRAWMCQIKGCGFCRQHEFPYQFALLSQGWGKYKRVLSRLIDVVFITS